MIHFDLPKQKSSIIKVIGVGGGGSNAVNYMFAQDVEGVDFIICNTDAKAIEMSKVPNKVQLGPMLTQGLGAGANPEVGKAATVESLEEIKQILEVNTRMAFITVGMGGGTGTGGAPIVAKICKELDILTVGIVTTPFGFEGPKRMQQAQAGINELKPFVDTLLVISNDKLRMQYGNLKMKDAFIKADTVLATAAKCITDIINSKGHIIVDFADVCTVMRSGGVAILGKAEVEGGDRAQVAIEEALNSPLLNDNEIKGAKWILININSAEGEQECTMDELEIINTYLRTQAGDDTDVIVGMGYDNSLDKKISITIIATGFDSKDPFLETKNMAKANPENEKLMMTLDVSTEDKKPIHTMINKPLEEVDTPQLDPLQPTLQEPIKTSTDSATDITIKKEQMLPTPSTKSINTLNGTEKIHIENQLPTFDFDMKIIEKNEVEPTITSEQKAEFNRSVFDEDAEEQKRKAAERIQKLRNLSFNIHNNSDVNTEFDTVPAYVRRNMELFSKSFSTAENFYSKYTVQDDENNQAQISTLNTFLDGKKPD